MSSEPTRSFSSSDLPPPPGAPTPPSKKRRIVPLVIIVLVVVVGIVVAIALVTNQGSDSIAVFKIQPNGGLQAVTGSPFPSGGMAPRSLGLSGSTLSLLQG